MGLKIKESKSDASHSLSLTPYPQKEPRPSSPFFFRRKVVYRALARINAQPLNLLLGQQMAQGVGTGPGGADLTVTRHNVKCFANSLAVAVAVPYPRWFRNVESALLRCAYDGTAESEATCAPKFCAFCIRDLPRRTELLDTTSASKLRGTNLRCCLLLAIVEERTRNTRFLCHEEVSFSSVPVSYEERHRRQSDVSPNTTARVVRTKIHFSLSV